MRKSANGNAIFQKRRFIIVIKVPSVTIHRLAKYGPGSVSKIYFYLEKKIFYTFNHLVIQLLSRLC